MEKKKTAASGHARTVLTLLNSSGHAQERKSFYLFYTEWTNKIRQKLIKIIERKDEGRHKTVYDKGQCRMKRSHLDR